MRALTPQWLRSCLLVLVAGSAFGLVSSALRPAVPWPLGFEIGEKLEAFEQLKDECDVLYFGSSYVYRSFRPEIVDRELSALGVDVTSFNFGIGGMGAFEVDHLLREVLAMKPARLRWVVIEPRPYFSRIAGSPNAFTERSLRWHTARATWQALRSSWRSHDSVEQKRKDAAVHLRLFARRLGNFGLGRTMLSAWLGLNEASDLVQIFVHHRGYLALEDMQDSAYYKKRRDLLLNKPAQYAKDVARLDKLNAGKINLATVNVQAFRLQSEAVRAAGVIPLAVLPPGLLASPTVFALWKEDVVQDIYRFNSPLRHPELFAIDMRFDRNHLNREGAVLFSKLFAEEFAARLAEDD